MAQILEFSIKKTVMITCCLLCDQWISNLLARSLALHVTIGTREITYSRLLLSTHCLHQRQSSAMLLVSKCSSDFKFTITRRCYVNHHWTRSLPNYLLGIQVNGGDWVGGRSRFVRCHDRICSRPAEEAVVSVVMLVASADDLVWTLCMVVTVKITEQWTSHWWQTANIESCIPGSWLRLRWWLAHWLLHCWCHSNHCAQ